MLNQQFLLRRPLLSLLSFFSDAGCGRYVQGFSLKATSSPYSWFEHPAFCIVQNVNSNTLCRSFLMLNQQFLLRRPLFSIRSFFPDAGCGRYVQGFSLKATGSSFGCFEHPASCIVQNVNSKNIQRSFFMFNQQFLLRRPLFPSLLPFSYASRTKVR